MGEEEFYPEKDRHALLPAHLVPFCSRIYCNMSQNSAECVEKEGALCSIVVLCIVVLCGRVRVIL